MSLPVLPFSDNGSVNDLCKYVGRVLIKDNGNDTCDKVKKAFASTNVDVLVSAAKGVDETIKLLDAGAFRVFVETRQTVDALTEAGVDAGRIVLSAGADLAAAKAAVADAAVAGVLVDAADKTAVSELAATAAKTLVKSGGAIGVYVFSAEDFGDNVTAIVPLEQLTADKDGSGVNVADFYVRRLTSDRPDGLFTTIVVDEADRALGVVYSSAESVRESFRTGSGVYQSRKRGLWYKGASSGATQKLLGVSVDCDSDVLRFAVDQTPPGFCHNNTYTCFGQGTGLGALEKLLVSRMQSAPAGSYTARLFSDAALLRAKLMEEAEELCDASSKDEVAWEAADLLYFAMAKVVKSGVSLAEVERNLDMKHLKISRRKGDAKPKWANATKDKESAAPAAPAAPAAAADNNASGDRIKMNTINAATATKDEVAKVLTRPVQKTADIMKLVVPIVEAVRDRGDKALLELTAKFDRVELKTPVLKAPFDPKSMEVDDEVRAAIDLSIDNVEKFHAAQLAGRDRIEVETAPGVVCSRFARPIESVGLYVPGGTAVLPSTTIMLGVPAKVAGCKNIVIASPPRKDGTLTPEVVYVAHKIGASAIVLAGGAQAVAALAYGTESVPKVDKIMGPGNQFVTAAKMHVQNDTNALCSIDMPAGPSEVLVVADGKANPAFVASDLLSQAEHGVDSQVILLAVGMSDTELAAVEDEIHEQALRLPRVDIVRKSIAHSTILRVDTIEDAMRLSNQYAPEHLILQVEDAASLVPQVEHAGSVFVGAWSPESCGDYSSGTNHTLPTYGYARMYSGVNTDTFLKHITSQELTEQGLRNIGPAVMALAAREGLDAHRNAVKVRLESLKAL